jgi:surfeit locus 1 family protein
MSISFANRRFRPKLVPSLVALVLVPGLMSLGFWQLRRAEEKRVLTAQFAVGESTTQELTAANVATLPLLQTVTVEGRYDNAHQILLDNMPSEQSRRTVTGYHVLTPLITGNDIVLINRGWIPLGSSRAQLPDINVTEQMRLLRGRLVDLPRAGIHLSAATNDGTWPRVMNFPTYAELSAVFGQRLLTKIVLLDPAEPDGMRRDWSKRYSFGEFGPERHIGYAVQWFGLAATLVVLYLLSQFRKPSDELSR